MTDAAEDLECTPNSEPVEEQGLAMPYEPFGADDEYGDDDDAGSTVTDHGDADDSMMSTAALSPLTVRTNLSLLSLSSFAGDAAK